ncbi:MAG TPA: sulfite exporter TauE/SafE family protein, partial [Nannocystis sp.]
MMYLVVGLVALLASGLTFFSGFGLGTLLMPAFALFFPVDVAVAMTAVVHLLNGLFKLVLVGREIDRRVAVRFGVPAVAAAMLGARLLVWLAALPALHTYTAFGRTLQITPAGLGVGVLMLLFAFVELAPGVKKLAIDPRYLPLGGLVSGFFGGLSGHQGA